VKGQGVLIEAIATLARDGADVTLTLVGDGPRRPALERLAHRHGVADRVRFTGRVGQDDIGAHYAAADVFCLSSFAEGVPVVLMEAMASGIPVVATRINGIPELIEDGESGILVTPGRADLLAAALRDMLGDDSRRATLAAAGRRRVAADFEVNACARELRALMGRFGVIDRNGGRQSPEMIR
jgi:colanic acid/amylovoran biosynthesis glycosyltransferase